jgi:hypothetical protein
MPEAPFHDVIPSDRPPALVAAVVPSDALRALLGQADPDQLVEAQAKAAFAEANPGLAEWLARRDAAKIWNRAAEAEALRFAAQLQRTDDAKTIPAGKEDGLKESLDKSAGTVLLLLAACITVASSLNVTAAYVVESAAWSSLVDHPWQAYLFSIVVPAAGAGGLLAIASELRDDRTKRRFRLGLGVATVLLWVAWLAGLAKLYALQSLIGDSGGRRLPADLIAADSALHAWLLITQLLAEVSAGALLKLMSAQATTRGTKQIVVPLPLYEHRKEQLQQSCAVASAAAADCGRIDDYERNYAERLQGFIAACRAEFSSLKAGAEAAQASARVTFLRPVQPQSAGGAAPAARRANS